jgi:hypothetical protein
MVYRGHVANGTIQLDTDAVLPEGTEVEVAVLSETDSNSNNVEGDGLRVAQEPDALNWDDLIPVPPDRPGGRLPVRLVMAGRDKPLPADDPWAE